MGPFSITGQPNAMGGREVGGLATTLAAHMELDNPRHRATVQKFWESPRIASEPGLCAVDLFDAIADGRIKAVWIMGTNPVDRLPEANRVKTALSECPLVIVSDVAASTDTLDYAHVADIFREHAQLSTYRNNASRDFDVGACTNMTIDEYDSLKPFYWP